MVQSKHSVTVSNSNKSLKQTQLETGLNTPETQTTASVDQLLLDRKASGYDIYTLLFVTVIHCSL